jgi:hypothetical protein
MKFAGFSKIFKKANKGLLERFLKSHDFSNNFLKTADNKIIRNKINTKYFSTQRVYDEISKKIFNFRKFN